METLVAVAYHRNQYYNGSRNGGNTRNGFDLGLSPLKGFREVNCRGFEAGMGLLPNPFSGFGSPVSNRGVFSPNSKTPSKTSPILINLKGGKKEIQMRENMCYSERWAGPAYSNSPPPSSVPMPNFGTMKPKRTVSLELPSIESDLSLPLISKSKSAPTSPTKKEGINSSNGFFSDGELATKTLRRILNLDIIDD